MYEIRKVLESRSRESRERELKVEIDTMENRGWKEVGGMKFENRYCAAPLSYIYDIRS